MNNLYSVVSNSLGFTRAISVEPEKFPVLLEDILIKPNDFLTENNFNFSLSCLYQDFLSIVSDSYVYSPNFPVTNPVFDNINNIVGTLCGTFVPSNYSTEGTNSIRYFINGIPHSDAAFNIIYNTHDFVISGNYLTLAVGILSATTISPVLSSNVYFPALGIYNYPLSAIFINGEVTNSSEFPNQGFQESAVVPNFGIVTKFLNKNLNLKYNSITKLKIANDRLYVLDNISNKFLIYDLSDAVINRINPNALEVPLETLGFATTSRLGSRKISSFCVNENYIAFFNYVTNAVSIFSTNLNQLYDYSQDRVSVSGVRNTELFADIEFDPFGNLYLLTQSGTVYVYSVSNTALTKIKTYNILPQTTSVFSSLSGDQVNNVKELYKKISFSKSDTNVFYVSTNSNIYKRFVDRNINIGQFNNFVNNTTYYSTLSNIADPFNTLLDPNNANYPNQKTPFDFLKYSLKSINSVKYNGYEIFSVCFTDNCTYTTQNIASGTGNIGNITPYGSINFRDANITYGMNPVSASGITFVVDRPNYINLNNSDLSAVEVYSFDEIQVRSEEFITDFTINKSLRKLLFNIFNYQTYQAFKPVVDIDINNNAIYKKLEYIVSFNKDQNITNFDNFIGINEITSTIFLNRCFTKVYELLVTLQDNFNSRVINVYPRYSDSVLLNQTSQKFASFYNDSEQFVSGEFDTEIEPLNPNLCVIETPSTTVVAYSPTPTPTPLPATPFVTVTPTPLPSPTLPPTPTPSGYVLVNKTIQHIATVYLNNQFESPPPQPPYPNFDIKPLSAIYDGTGIDTIVSEFSAYFDQSGFYAALSNVGGDYTKLVGMQFGNYVLQSYTPATNSEFVLGGQGCDLNTTGNI
jgi:hypothetical protein